MGKICSECRIEKPLDYFEKRKDSKDGFRNECKDCRQIKSKNYYQNNKDNIIEKNNAYYYKNKRQISMKNNVRYENNKEKILKNSKEYRDNHKEEIKRRYKNFFDINKKKVSIQQKEYREEHKEEIRKNKFNYSKNHKEQRNKRTRERKKLDVVFKLSENIRGLVKKSIKREGYSKKSKTFEILGCSFNFLLEYIFKKANLRYLDFKIDDFLEKNKYHIDHIIPLSLAKTEEDVIKLNHYTNLQLLTKEENLEKSDKLDWE